MTGSICLMCMTICDISQCFLFTPADGSRRTNRRRRTVNTTENSKLSTVYVERWRPRVPFRILCQTVDNSMNSAFDNQCRPQSRSCSCPRS